MLFSLLIISGTIGINLLARLLLIDFWRCILFLIHIGPGAQRQFQCTNSPWSDLKHDGAITEEDDAQLKKEMLGNH
jgi:hypothetical protein